MPQDGRRADANPYRYWIRSPILSGRIVVALLLLMQSFAAKQRSWLGPEVFLDGSPPAPRDAAGIAWSSGKLYVFGGYGYNGDCRNRST